MMRLRTCTNHIATLHASHRPLNDDGLKAKGYALVCELIFMTREIVIITKKVNFAQVGNRRWLNDSFNELLFEFGGHAFLFSFWLDWNLTINIVSFFKTAIDNSIFPSLIYVIYNIVFFFLTSTHSTLASPAVFLFTPQLQCSASLSLPISVVEGTWHFTLFISTNFMYTKS